jgi:hypothetical protein
MKIPLTEQATQGIQPCRSFSHPSGAKPVQRGQNLLGHALDRHGRDVLVAAGLQDALGIGAVGLVAADVGSDVVRREQDHVVPKSLEFPAPVVRRSAGFHDHSRGGLLCHERQELGPLQAFAPRHPPGLVGNRDLENSLCHVHGNASIVSHDGLLLCLSSNDFGTSMPVKSWRSPSHQCS